MQPKPKAENKKSARSSGIANLLQAGWRKKGVLARSLFPLSLLLGYVAAMRRAGYARGWLRSTRLNVPVIVIGNIYVGGTGKTPLTIWLAQELIIRGWSPGVVSRGYGARNDSSREVTLEGGFFGDEPALIAQRARIPVFIGRNRVEAARALLQAHPTVNLIISDDGLQHYALQRDLEIAVVDDRLYGNGWLLPAGPLREPPSRLNNVDAIVLHGRIRSEFERPVFRMHLVGLQAVHLMTGQTRELAAFRSLKVMAAAGIGRPQRFFSFLNRHGIACRGLALPDHFDFSANPFTWVPEPVILVTEKDAVKCRAFNDARIWAVPVQAHLNPSFIDFVMEKLNGPPLA